MDETFTDTNPKPRRASAILQTRSLRLKLQLDTNAVCALEEVFGCLGVLPSLARVVDGSLSGVRAAVFAMTRGHHPTLRIEQIGALLDEQDTFVRAKEVIVTLIEEFHPPLKGVFRAVPDDEPPADVPETTPPATPPAATPNETAAPPAAE